MSSAVHYADTASIHEQTWWAGVQIIESTVAPRGRVLCVDRGAFLNAPSTPAMVAHPLEAHALRIAIATGRPMTDLAVRTEALHAYIAACAEKRARVAMRRIDRLVAEADERTRLRIETFLHPAQHLMYYDGPARTSVCADCDYEIHDIDLHRLGLRVDL